MSRKRWIKRALAGLLALGSAGGCKQQLFMEPGDYRDAVMNNLPRGLENSPQDAIVPEQVDRKGGVPNVLDTNRPGRMMTLQECIAIALEQGNVGNQSPANFGFKNESIDVQNGQVIPGSDAVKVFAVDPAIAATFLERSLSKFDARWVTSMTWQKFDQPTAAQFLSFQNSRDAANLNTTLLKPLPTGGTAGITFSTDYSKFATNATAGNQFVNPNYIPRLQFSFEQPLLRLFGVEINQLAPNHPGSTLLNFGPSGGQGTEGILISRIRVDQQKADFETKINYLLVNVETAYWNLYAAYYNLYAQEEGLRQAFEGYRFINIRVQVGNQPPQDVYQAQAQFERFRRQVYQARGQVLEAERQLRGLLGVRSDDGTRIVPIDNPNEAAYRPDFYEAANEAMANRPELLQARQTLKFRQLNLLLQKNLRRADLRVFGQYDVAGLGTRLDGPEFIDPPTNNQPGNALANFASDQFNSWTIGLRADMPIGFRDANAQVREAQLNLAKSYFQLRDAEMKALEYLVAQYRRVIQAHAEIGPARREREALQIYLGKVREVIKIGRWDANYFQNYLTVQRDLATAIANEFRAIADYNSALAALELAKGTIQRYNNVSVNEGALPPWVHKKAADHIRERTESALKLRERDSQPPPGGPSAIGGVPVGPAIGTPFLDNLPPFAEKREPLPDALPDPRPVDPKKMPPMPPGGGLGAGLGAGVGVRPLPTLPALPAPTGGATTPGATSPISAVPAAEDFFRPAGRVNFPTGPTPGAGGSPAPAPLPTGATTPLPTGTGMAPLPIPPIGSSLPVPPPGPGDIEFGPAGSILPIPKPPGS